MVDLSIICLVSIHLEQRREGVLVVISSVATDLGRQSNCISEALEQIRERITKAYPMVTSAAVRELAKSRNESSSGAALYLKFNDVRLSVQCIDVSLDLVGRVVVGRSERRPNRNSIESNSGVARSVIACQPIHASPCK